MRQRQLSSFFCSWAEETSMVMKNQKWLYFTHMGSAPCWANLIEIWVFDKDRRRNHLCQILWKKYSGSTML